MVCQQSIRLWFVLAVQSVETELLLLLETETRWASTHVSFTHSKIVSKVKNTCSLFFLFKKSSYSFYLFLEAAVCHYHNYSDTSSECH